MLRLPLLVPLQGATTPLRLNEVPATPSPPPASATMQAAGTTTPPNPAAPGTGSPVRSAGASAYALRVDIGRDMRGSLLLAQVLFWQLEGRHS